MIYLCVLRRRVQFLSSVVSGAEALVLIGGAVPSLGGVRSISSHSVSRFSVKGEVLCSS